MRLSLPPPRVRAQAQADWLVVLDDALREAVRHCMLCGCYQGKVSAWFDITEAGGVVVVTLLCESCQRRDPERAQLLARLLACYGL